MNTDNRRYKDKGLRRYDMNDEQRDCFALAYNHVHDERLDNVNLMASIDICFPDPDESEVSKALHGLKSYLTAREKAGAWVMESMYDLEEKMHIKVEVLGRR